MLYETYWRAADQESGDEASALEEAPIRIRKIGQTVLHGVEFGYAAYTNVGGQIEDL